jgi:hypothetical protein
LYYKCFNVHLSTFFEMTSTRKYMSQFCKIELQVHESKHQL